MTEGESYNYRSKKIVAVLSADIPAGVALNVLGHLAVAVGAYAERDIMGRENYPDASGIPHLGISKYPFIVTKGKPAKIKAAIESARENPLLLLADYPKEMLDTGHDDELAEAISKKANQEMEYLGAVIYGPADEVNKITGKFSLWRD